ncbi:MAG: hypothetical protein V4634_22510 [Pseudomonadota bacterium]
MTRPIGLALIGLAIVLPFGIWRLVLGANYPAVGIKPLAMGYIGSAMSLVAGIFFSCYVEYSGRVAKGLLSETQRWAIVPGWSVTLTVISLILVLPLVGLVGVPGSAILLRRRRLNFHNIGVFLFVLWISLSIIFLALSSNTNEWHRTHRLESFTDALTGLSVIVGVIFVPFFLAIHRASRTYRLMINSSESLAR